MFLLFACHLEDEDNTSKRIIKYGEKEYFYLKKKKESSFNVVAVFVVGSYFLSSFLMHKRIESSKISP